ncbi:hypothetical protein [Pseudonocardia sp.]|nr:hypothetical protein [Pseudonocardia sp.]
MRAWNRTPAKAAALAVDGALVAPSPTAPPTPRTVKGWSFHSPMPS